jgi:hypothetical protein
MIYCIQIQGVQIKAEVNDMNAKEFRSGAFDRLQKAGVEVDSVILDKAIAKAKRHMVAKYGSVDYDEEVGESGFGNVESFYRETQNNPNGMNTFNRDRAKAARI